MDDPKAGIFRRLVALLIDVFILDLLGILTAYPLQKELEISVKDILDPLLTGSGISQELILFIFLYATLMTFLWGCYFTFFIGWDGQTPGKKMLGIRVKRVDGRPIDYSTAGTRFIGYSVSASVLMIGFLWALFDENNQTWHDKMAQTIVVKNGS
ncbi:MAG: RDD family protein [Nitrospinaceae bacterium]